MEEERKLTRREWIDKYGGEKYSKIPPHYLYRYFNEDGLVLYIGITKNIKQRHGQHKCSSVWFRCACDITVEKYPSEQLAREAERKAIISEDPFWNRKFIKG